MNKNESATRPEPWLKRILSHSQALGLPLGSVRALLALGLVTALVVLIAMGREPGAIEALATTVVAFYFATRNGAKP